MALPRRRPILKPETRRAGRPRLAPGFLCFEARDHGHPGFRRLDPDQRLLANLEGRFDGLSIRDNGLLVTGVGERVQALVNSHHPEEQELVDFRQEPLAALSIEQGQRVGELRPVFVFEDEKRSERLLQIFKGPGELASLPQVKPEPKRVGGLEESVGIASGLVDAIRQFRLFAGARLDFIEVLGQLENLQLGGHELAKLADVLHFLKCVPHVLRVPRGQHIDLVKVNLGGVEIAFILRLESLVEFSPEHLEIRGALVEDAQ